MPDQSSSSFVSVGSDPVSGNPIPPGSNPEEVRDDIPAQLSEGEFVMPADVVRWHGVEKLVSMREEAKTGFLKLMQDGQVQSVSEDVSTIPSGQQQEEMSDDTVAPAPSTVQPSGGGSSFVQAAVGGDIQRVNTKSDKIASRIMVRDPQTGEPRVAIVDADTGEILPDTTGYQVASLGPQDSVNYIYDATSSDNVDGGFASSSNDTQPLASEYYLANRRGSGGGSRDRTRSSQPERVGPGTRRGIFADTAAVMGSIGSFVPFGGAIAAGARVADAANFKDAYGLGPMSGKETWSAARGKDVIRDAGRDAALAADSNPYGSTSITELTRRGQAEGMSPQEIQDMVDRSHFDTFQFDMPEDGRVGTAPRVADKFAQNIGGSSVTVSDALGLGTSLATGNMMGVVKEGKDIWDSLAERNTDVPIPRERPQDMDRTAEWYGSADPAASGFATSSNDSARRVASNTAKSPEKNNTQSGFAAYQRTGGSSGGGSDRSSSSPNSNQSQKTSSRSKNTPSSQSRDNDNRSSSSRGSTGGLY